MVKNNIMNIVESVSKSLSLRARCLKLEINLMWEGETILKMYKNINKLIEVNEQQFDCYNDLQFQTGNINTEINKDLDDIKCNRSKTIISIFNQIEKFNSVKIITEDKCRYLNDLHNKIPVTEELLQNRLSFLRVTSYYYYYYLLFITYLYLIVIHIIQYTIYIHIMYVDNIIQLIILFFNYTQIQIK